MSLFGICLRYSGMIATSVAVCWFTYILLQTGDFSNPIWSQASVWGNLALLSIQYALISLLLAVAWVLILGTEPHTRHISSMRKVSIFSISQIFKYLPTNTLHVIGRHVSFRQVGYSHSRLTWATVAETLLLIISAISLVLFYLADTDIVIPMLVKYAPPTSLYSILFLASALLVATVFALVYSLHKLIGASSSVYMTIVSLGTALFLYTLYFLLVISLVCSLPNILSISYSSNLEGFVVPYTSAWLAGTFLPGSPAGIGMRELTFTLVLEEYGLVTGGSLLALYFRLVTTLGDALLALIGKLFQKYVT